MKRVITWGAGVWCLVGLLTALWQLRDGNVATAVAQTAEESTASPPAPAAPADGTIVHRFADEASLQAFAKLWQRRQAALTRMAVLQAYWDQEQPGLNQVNQQLLAEYQLDVKKSYRLDTEQRVLLELPTPAQPVPAISSPSSPETPPTGSQP